MIQYSNGFLEEYYEPPQTIPVPDNFAAEAPRISLTSKNGHSQINFSQISMDLAVHFDGEFLSEFNLTKAYIIERLELLKSLLEKIGISDFYFCGLSYNIQMDTIGKHPIEYMKQYLGSSVKGDIYEASQRIAQIRDERFFVNQQIGTYREYLGANGAIQDLMVFSNSKLLSEGVSLNLDVNNRYEYMSIGKKKAIGCFSDIIA